MCHCHCLCQVFNTTFAHRKVFIFVKKIKVAKVHSHFLDVSLLVPALFLPTVARLSLGRDNKTAFVLHCLWVPVSRSRPATVCSCCACSFMSHARLPLSLEALTSMMFFVRSCVVSGFCLFVHRWTCFLSWWKSAGDAAN